MTGREYNMDDIEQLSDRARELLLVIAEQSGHTTTTSDDSDGDPPGDGDGGTGTVPVCTTRTLTKATGLSNSAVNYDLKKLTGRESAGVNGNALVTTFQQTVDETGQNRPKRIELTDAGKQAIDDDVIERTRLHTGPDWFPDDDAPSEQLRAIATRLDAHETVLNHVTAHIGYADMTDLTAATVNGTSIDTDADLVTSPDTPRDMTVLENLNRVAEGQKAIVEALQDTGANPAQYLDR